MFASYQELKKANPNFPLLVREAEGAKATLVARYGVPVSTHRAVCKHAPQTLARRLLWMWRARAVVTLQHACKNSSKLGTRCHGAWSCASPDVVATHTRQQVCRE